MTRNSFGLAALILASALLLSAATGSRWDHVPAKFHDRTNPLADLPDSKSAGALAYREHCQQCHRADAMGDNRRKPALRSERIRSATDGDLEWFLRQGDLPHGMPSWSSLPEAQRWQIVAYLRSIQ
jgi:mono/diheme cytochrome c family protein